MPCAEDPRAYSFLAPASGSHLAKVKSKGISVFDFESSGGLHGHMDETSGGYNQTNRLVVVVVLVVQVSLEVVMTPLQVVTMRGRVVVRGAESARVILLF